ncbi:MAG: hypothetical protein Q4B54_06050 [Coriobacteriales bacterium]|nr:hypothetical protein [Coriobacteriales bacterium]
MTTALERRYRDTLRIAGVGMIVFGIWAVVRNYITVVVYEEEIRQYFFGLDPFLMVMVPATLELAMRLFVGFGARAESKGAKGGKAYLVVAALIALIHLLGIVVYILSVIMQYAWLDEAIMLVVIDATCLYLVLDLIVSAVKLRRLEREDG